MSIKASHDCHDCSIPEQQVQNSLVKNLERDGYTVIEQCLDDPTKFQHISSCKTHHMHGIDVVAQKDEELWIIEVKGKPRGGVASCSTIFMAGLGQIMSRISSISPRTNYSLAIPNSRCYSPTVRLFIHSPVLDNLNLSILLVQNDDSLDVIK